MPKTVHKLSNVFECPYCGDELPMSDARYHDNLSYLAKGMKKICDSCGESISKREFKDNVRPLIPEQWYDDQW